MRRLGVLISKAEGSLSRPGMINERRLDEHLIFVDDQRQYLYKHVLLAISWL